MIPVTKPFIPPFNELCNIMERAVKNEWLTNRGELVLELEKNLSTYLELEKSRALAMTNGTIPLQIALKLLGKKGEIITTPFSYVATTSTILWEHCTPKFVDIDPEYLTIDESKIEDAITDKTTCILATHVFGNPCNIDEIEKIAEKYNLKVIYDAAHCFGVKYKGKSIFEYGDVSTCSFHATKLFQTGEGGAVFCKDKELFHKLFYSHNFGHNGPLFYHGLGINGKMSELQAAMGLSVLPYMDDIIMKRRKLVDLYNQELSFHQFEEIKIRNNTQFNYGYFPILFNDSQKCIAVHRALEEKKIYSRRYFYPSLDTLEYIKTNFEVPVSHDISRRVLCLPLFSQLKEKEVLLIVKMISETLC